MDEALRKKISNLINSKKVFLFMKGTPDYPECGFSAKTVETLRDLGIDFEFFNVFDDEAVRQGIKEFTNWPTIPQLYINGQFIGGCDIVMQMAESGELQKITA